MDELKVGDLVWAKMKGFSPWPGRVTTPKPFLKKPNLKNDSLCIFFFGTHNYAFIELTNLKPYEEYKSKFLKSCKSASFKEAIDDIETFMRKSGEDPNYNPEEHIKQSSQSTDEDSADIEEDDDDDQEQEDIDEDEGPKSKKRRKMTSTAKLLKLTKSRIETGPGTPTGTPLMEKNGPAKETNLTKVETKMKNEEGKPKREPSQFVIGFLGLGRMGKNIVTNMVKSGHKVNIWNRTSEKADSLKDDLEEQHPGLVQAFKTPSDIARNSDIIFSCLTDFSSVKNVWYGECGLGEVETYEGKGYVELTNVGTENSIETNKIVSDKGGKYLEAQLQGGVQEAEDGKLVILVAGNEQLYDDCNSCFEAVGKTIFYFGKVGSASKMNLILQVMRGVSMVGMQESFALANKCGLNVKDALEIFSITQMNSPFLNMTANSIVNEDAELEHTMKHIRSDINMALEFSDVLKQPLVMAAAAKEAILNQLNK